MRRWYLKGREDIYDTFHHFESEEIERNPPDTHARFTLSNISNSVVSFMYFQIPAELGALYINSSASIAQSCIISNCSRTPRHKASLSAVLAEGHAEDLLIAGFWTIMQWLPKPWEGFASCLSKSHLLSSINITCPPP